MRSDAHDTRADPGFRELLRKTAREVALVVPERYHRGADDAHHCEWVARPTKQRFVDESRTSDRCEACLLILRWRVPLDTAHGSVASDHHHEPVSEFSRLAQVVRVPGVEQIERAKRHDGGKNHQRTRSSTVKWRVSDLCT
jgi:hypothetical protein